MLTGEDLVIQLFFWTSAFLAGVEAVKAAGWRIWMFFGLGALLFLAGLGWGRIKEIYPPLTGWVTSVATNPQSWFLLLVVFVVLVSVTGRARRRSQSNEPSEELEALSASLQDTLGRVSKIERAPAPPSVEDYDNLKTTVMSTFKDVTNLSERINRLSNSSESIEKLNRTAFLLSTAANDDVYRKRLWHYLKLVPQFPNDGPVDTNEKLSREKERIEDYLNDMISDLSESRWSNDLHMQLKEAEFEADQDLAKMVPPINVNPFIYRQFHIACFKRDRVDSFLKKSIEEADGQQRQMHQMIRDRPQLHKR